MPFPMLKSAVHRINDGRVPVRKIQEIRLTAHADGFYRFGHEEADQQRILVNLVGDAENVRLVMDGIQMTTSSPVIKIALRCQQACRLPERRQRPDGHSRTRPPIARDVVRRLADGPVDKSELRVPESQLLLCFSKVSRGINGEPVPYLQEPGRRDLSRIGGVMVSQSLIVQGSIGRSGRRPDLELGRRKSEPRASRQLSSPGKDRRRTSYIPTYPDGLRRG